MTIFRTPELSDEQFGQISELLYRMCDIRLKPGKEPLVKTRLTKRLRSLGLEDFGQYVDLVERDRSGLELTTLIDALTTNKTEFFREAQHFDFLRRELLPELAAGGRPLRFWCAGCSSGEEPFSLAILLCEELPEAGRREARILATDISTRMLERARRAVYPEEGLQGMAPALVERHFDPVGREPDPVYRVAEKLRGMVHLARLNLKDPWPMRGPFDAILCRNVMIYFDHATQGELVRRFHELLRPGGHLFVGHAESLTGQEHDFRYVAPAVYVKEEEDN